MIFAYKIVEKDDRLAVHGLFDSLERAEWHLRDIIPVYVARGYFDDKSLTADSFVIEPVPSISRRRR